MRRTALLIGLIAIALLVGGCSAAAGSTAGDSLAEGASITFNLPQDQTTLSNTVQMMLLLTGLALLPAVLLLMTSFVRIVVVLASLRTAIGVPMLPPNQVIIGLALLLSFFVMAPALQDINEHALQPYMEGQMPVEEAMTVGMAPMRNFMFRQVGEEELALFVHLAGLPRPHTPDDIPSYVLIPAFVISELKVAFQMVFIIYVPFLVIDAVISSALMSMGMMMLPPTIISLPFKLLLFVLVDGWNLIVRNLVLSFLT